MAKPRPSTQTPAPDPRRRRGAALLLTLAVLAAHGAALRARPQTPLPPVPAAPPVQLRVLNLPALMAPATPATHAAAPSLRAPAAPARPVARPPAAPRATPPTAPDAAPPPDAAPEPHRGEATETPAAPGAAATPAWPRYATRLPPAAVRHYLLQRGARSAPARLVWTHDAQGYELSLMAEGGELDGLGAASRGLVGPDGLVPQRHVERRRGRDLRATNFDLATAQLRGSGGGAPHPWPIGGQDRLSWLLQLAAVLQADAGLAQPGARVLLPVAGPRGPATAWGFTVRGPEPLSLADGRSVHGLALERPAQHPYDLQVEVWLDPADHHLPLRLRLSAPPGEWESVWLLAPAS